MLGIVWRLRRKMYIALGGGGGFFFPLLLGVRRDTLGIGYIGVGVGTLFGSLGMAWHGVFKAVFMWNHGNYGILANAPRYMEGI